MKKVAVSEEYDGEEWSSVSAVQCGAGHGALRTIWTSQRGLISAKRMDELRLQKRADQRELEDGGSRGTSGAIAYIHAPVTLEIRAYAIMLSRRS